MPCSDASRADDRASYRRFATAEELEQLVKDDLMVLLSERFEATGVPPTSTERRVAHRPRPRAGHPDRGEGPSHRRGTAALGGGLPVLTLIGPGGVGKSRLALESCRQPMHAFPDGVAFVPLETSERALRRHAGRSPTRSEPRRRATGRRSTWRSII